MVRRRIVALSAEERATLERLRDGDVGRFFDPGEGSNFVSLVISVGVALVFLYVQLPSVVVLGVGLTLYVTMIGALVARARSQHACRRRAASARWDPDLDRGEVEELLVEASAVVELFSDEGEEGWFLDVGEGQLLFLWWPKSKSFPNDRLQIRRLPASGRVLSLETPGQLLEPSRPRRHFRKKEYEPTQCESVSASLPTLDDDLVAMKRARTSRKDSEPRWSDATAELRTLVDAVEPLGFYKYVLDDDIEAIKAEILDSVWSWLHHSKRAYAADAEALAEGGIADLLRELSEVLDAERASPGEVVERFAVGGDYSLIVAGRERAIYTKTDGGARLWELAQEKTLEIVNDLLRDAGSVERAYLMSGGEDGTLVFLTPAMHECLRSSKAVDRDELPRDLAGTSHTI